MAETVTQTAPAATNGAGTQPQPTSTQPVGTQPTSQTSQATATPTSYKFGGKEYASVEDLGKAYEAANSELGKWTQKHGDLEKQYQQTSKVAQQWNDWWKTVQPLWGDDVEDVLRRKLSGGQQPQQRQAQPQQTPQPQQAGQEGGQFKGFEYLTPAEQFTKFREMLAGELQTQLQAERQQMAQQLSQVLQQKEQYYQQYLNNYQTLQRRALEQKLKNPDFNIDAVMEQAAKAISGGMDPIELGQQLLSAADFQNQIDKAKKEAYEMGKKDLEQEQKNKQVAVIPSQSGQAPTYKVPQGTNIKKGFLGLRENAAQNLVSKFPNVFAGE